MFSLELPILVPVSTASSTISDFTILAAEALLSHALDSNVRVRESPTAFEALAVASFSNITLPVNVPPANGILVLSVPPVELIVTLSLVLSVVMLTLVPATSVSVSVALSAETGFCPATATVLNAFWLSSPPL